MQTALVLYIATLLIFLVIDALGLTFLLRPAFERGIGPLMADPIRIGPAAMFYAFFIGALVWFVSWPAVQGDHGVWWVIGNALILGAVGYGTYEFTNYAILRDWTWEMVILDFCWGISLTAVSALGGVCVTRWVI